MRLVVNQTPLRRIRRWAHWALFTGAVLMLAYCAFVLIDTWIFQKRERGQLERLLSGGKEANGRGSQTESPASPKNSALAMTDGLVGRIDIPRLGLSVIVMEGTSRTTLRRAVGHISGTALPGQQGNVGISGHRDTFFRPLRNIEQNDVITLTTLLGEHHYRVVSIKVVGPYDISVLDPSGNEILTLVTCYPFTSLDPPPTDLSFGPNGSSDKLIETERFSDDTDVQSRTARFDLIPPGAARPKASSSHFSYRIESFQSIHD